MNFPNHKQFYNNAIDYALAVDTGEQVAGPYVRQACRQFLDVIRQEDEGDYPYYFDAERSGAIEHAITERLQVPLGPHAGKSFMLFGWHKFVLACVFGVLRKRDGCRRYREAYIEIGRGNVKSSFASAVALVKLFDAVGGTTRGAQAVSAASTAEQAGSAFRMAASMGKAAIEAGHYPSLHVSGQPNTAHLIHDKATEVMFKRIAYDKDGSGRSGQNVSFNLVDEFSDHEHAAFYEALVYTTRSDPEGLTVCLTNTGWFDTPAYAKHQECVKVLADPDSEPTIFAYICALDDGDYNAKTRKLKDPTVSLPKTNPCIGGEYGTPDVDFTLAQYRKAQRNKDFAPEFLRNSLNLWQDKALQGVAIFVTDDVIPCEMDEAVFNNMYPKERLAEMPTCLSADLALLRDLTSLCQVWYDADTGTVIAKWRHWIPHTGLVSRQEETGVPFVEWVEGGFIETCPGAMMDYSVVAAAVEDALEMNQCKDILFAFDSWRFERLVEELEKFKLPFKRYGENGAGRLQLIPHLQGATPEPLQTEKVPEERRRRLYFPKSLEQTEDVVLGKRIVWVKNPVARMALTGAKVTLDGKRNRTFVRDNRNVNIDAFISVVQGVGALLMINKDRTITDAEQVVPLVDEDVLSSLSF